MLWGQRVTRKWPVGHKEPWSQAFPPILPLLLMIESLGSTLRHKKSRGIKGPGPLSPGSCIKVKKSLKGGMYRKGSVKGRDQREDGFLKPPFHNLPHASPLESLFTGWCIYVALFFSCGSTHLVVHCVTNNQDCALTAKTSRADSTWLLTIVITASTLKYGNSRSTWIIRTN